MTFRRRALHSTLVVDGVSVEVTRKRIRTLRLGVRPPEGRVRVAAPLQIADVVILRFIASKLAWIRKHQARMAERPLPVPPSMTSGERHALLGREYTLEVVEGEGPTGVSLHDWGVLELRVRPASDREARAGILRAWCRARLREQAGPLIAMWEQRLGVRVAAWGIRRMKTRWGSCNVVARRVSLSLELVKYPMPCIEYVVVHELVHLLEASHGPKFVALMDLHLPEWRARRRELNAVAEPRRGHPAGR